MGSFYNRVEVQLVREECAPFVAPQRVKHGGDIAALANKIIGKAACEHFLVVMLDSQNGILGVHTVSIGTLNATYVHPREVFKAAVLMNAASIIAVHNHPSGDPKPSADDHKVTERLKLAGEILGITLLDSIVIGHERYYSLAEEGTFPIDL